MIRTERAGRVIPDASRRAFMIFMLLAPWACTVNRLPDPGPGGDFAWKMSGGSAARTNASAARPKPPFRVEWEVDAGSGFGPASPGVSDSLLFVSTLTGEVRAVNLYTGEDRGSYDFGTAIFGTPLLLPGRLVVALSGDEENLVSYNLLTGVVQWSARTGSFESSLLAMENGIIAAGLDGSLTKFNIDNGEEIWKYNPPERSPSRSSPASDGTRVIFGSDRGHVVSVDLSSGGFLWKLDAGAPVLTTPVVTDGMVFITAQDGSVFGIEAESGTISWKRELGSPLFGSPAVDDGRVFVGTSGAEVVALAAADGAILWRTAVLGAVGSAPLSCGGILYVGDLDKNLYAIASAGGETLWQTETPGRVRCTPVAVPGRIVVLSEDRAIIGYVEER